VWAATVTFAGLVAAGEFQFNVIVPPSQANGDQPVTAMHNGVRTPPGTLDAVRQQRCLISANFKRVNWCYR
jgi:uncharacterized protein (TIGR03437 family)